MVDDGTGGSIDRRKEEDISRYIIEDDDSSNDPRMFILRRLQVIVGAMMILAAVFGAFYFIERGPSLQTAGAIVFFFGVMVFVTMLLVMGARTMAAVISIQREVIPRRDRKLLEPLIANGEEKAIDQYVRLSSLTGITGLATKLGLTGLPLLTVALTLIFSALEIYKPGSGFMDLTKLTLGAFIGSFVQRVATAQQVASTVVSGRLPPEATN